MPGSITEIATTKPGVYAFRLMGKVSDSDLEKMATTMLNAFDAHGQVNMLLLFDGYEGSEALSSLQIRVMKAQAKALSSVRKYAVVGAPGLARAIINASDRGMPVDAQTFEVQDLDKAWLFVEAQPRESVQTPQTTA